MRPLAACAGALACTAGLWLFVATVRAEHPGMVFQKGLYRMEGSCGDLRKHGSGTSVACQSYVGVLVKEHDKPAFMFFDETGGMLAFRSPGSPTYTDDNNRATYPIEDVLNGVDNLVYNCSGECTVTSVPAQGVHVVCTTWTPRDRDKVCFSARVEGNGIWGYQP
jgi:hypothetical protein